MCFTAGWCNLFKVTYVLIKSSKLTNWFDCAAYSTCEQGITCSFFHMVIFFFQCISNIILWIHVFMFIVYCLCLYCTVLEQQTLDNSCSTWIYQFTVFEAGRFKTKGQDLIMTFLLFHCLAEVEGQKQISNGKTASHVRRSLFCNYSLNPRLRAELPPWCHYGDQMLSTRT